MKELYFFLTITLLSITTITSHAQFSKFEIGVQSGPNLAIIRKSDILSDINYFSGFKQELGFYSGIYFKFRSHEHFYLMTSMNYEQKNMNAGYVTVNQNPRTVNIKIDYLQIPLLLNVTFGKRAKVIINAGPYIAWELRSAAKVEENYISEVLMIKETDSGVIAGIGTSYEFKFPLSISFELRNNIGLRAIAYGNPKYGGRAKNYSLSFLFGIGYSFGKASRGS